MMAYSKLYIEKIMRKAIRIAEKGRGRVSPNPLVGALLIKNGRIVSRGAHLFYGGPHAEIHALRKAGTRARDADLFVTLEPCSTYGHTGPCTNAIIQAGVKRVFVGAVDPNPKHQRRGLDLLRRAGIKVRSGFLADEVAEQNKGFFSVMIGKRPFVTLKMAQSLDGKIATVSGQSKWITSEKTRNFVHKLRSEADGIMVGTRTVSQDNPRLSVQKVRRRLQPARIVLDRMLRLRARMNVFRNDGAKVYLVTSKNLVVKAARQWKSRVCVLGVREEGGRLDLTELLKKLAAQAGVTSVLVEGGGELAASFIEEGLVDRIYWCVAPILVGGREARTSVEGSGIKQLVEAHRVKISRVLNLGGDLIVEGKM